MRAKQYIRYHQVYCSIRCDDLYCLQRQLLILIINQRRQFQSCGQGIQAPDQQTEVPYHVKLTQKFGIVAPMRSNCVRVNTTSGFVYPPPPSYTHPPSPPPPHPSRPWPQYAYSVCTHHTTQTKVTGIQVTHTLKAHFNPHPLGPFFNPHQVGPFFNPHHVGPFFNPHPVGPFLSFKHQVRLPMMSHRLCNPHIFRTTRKISFM